MENLLKYVYKNTKIGQLKMKILGIPPYSPNFLGPDWGLGIR